MNHFCTKVLRPIPSDVGLATRPCRWQDVGRARVDTVTESGSTRRSGGAESRLQSRAAYRIETRTSVHSVGWHVYRSQNNQSLDCSGAIGELMPGCCLVVAKYRRDFRTCPVTMSTDAPQVKDPSGRPVRGLGQISIRRPAFVLQRVTACAYCESPTQCCC